MGNKSEDYLAHIKALAERIGRQKEKWLESTIYPHLQDLLNKAQSRLRRRIMFLSGNGTWAFSFQCSTCYDKVLVNQLQDAVSQPELKGRVHEAIRRRFPELVEFCNIVVAVQDELDETIGDVYPTVKPKGNNDKGDSRESA